MDREGVPFPHVLQRLLQLRPVRVLARCLVGEYAVKRDAVELPCSFWSTVLTRTYPTVCVFIVVLCFC
jgi:hypothetical protein